MHDAFDDPWVLQYNGLHGEVLSSPQTAKTYVSNTLE